MNKICQKEGHDYDKAQHKTCMVVCYRCWHPEYKKNLTAEEIDRFRIKLMKREAEL